MYYRSNSMNLDSQFLSQKSRRSPLIFCESEDFRLPDISGMRELWKLPSPKLPFQN